MENAAPISLYLDLAPGEIADIEVVARAALAWSAAIKEMAYVVDPSIEIQVDLISGTEGSLGLNACIRVVKQLSAQRPKLTTIVVTSLTWFTLQTAQYSYAAILDWLTGKNAPTAVKHLTKQEIEALAAEIVKISANTAKPQRQQVYRELERDTSIVGVGSSEQPGVRPKSIVPRSEFAERSGTEAVPTTDEIKRRTVPERLNVVLVSPTLKNAERRWKFQVGTLPEFGATMKDHEFLEAFAAGRTAIPLKPGVEMEIDLETKEEFEGGVWVARDRNVVRVLKPGIIDDGSGLPFSPRQPN